MTILKYSVATILISVPALAQTNGTFLLTSSNTVSPTTPTTRIEIWTTWSDPSALFYFAAGNYDLTAGDGLFSNPTNIMQGAGSSAGVANGNVVSGGVNGQLFFFGTSSDNPILLASYDWTTTDFTPRTVSLDTTNTTNFGVGWLEAGPGGIPAAGTFVSLFPNEFTPGSGVITVVPAPAVWLALALPLVAGRRRRR